MRILEKKLFCNICNKLPGNNIERSLSYTGCLLNRICTALLQNYDRESDCNLFLSLLFKRPLVRWHTLKLTHIIVFTHKSILLIVITWFTYYHLHCINCFILFNISYLSFCTFDQQLCQVVVRNARSCIFITNFQSLHTPSWLIRLPSIQCVIVIFI